jgi:hypothetical protein
MAVTLTALSVNPGLMVQSVLLLDHTRAATRARRAVMEAR